MVPIGSEERRRNTSSRAPLHKRFSEDHVYNLVIIDEKKPSSRHRRSSNPNIGTIRKYLNRPFGLFRTVVAHPERPNSPGLWLGLLGWARRAVGVFFSDSEMPDEFVAAIK